MKYWNKDKKFRRTWHTVTSPKLHLLQQAKVWCQQQESTGRFYFHYTNTRWWFEFETDALMFTLKWSA